MSDDEMKTQEQRPTPEQWAYQIEVQARFVELAETLDRIAKERLEQKGRADEAEKNVQILRDALLFLPLDCDCGRTKEVAGRHASDCPVAIRDEALAATASTAPAPATEHVVYVLRWPAGWDVETCQQAIGSAKFRGQHPAGTKIVFTHADLARAWAQRMRESGAQVEQP